MNSIQKFKIRKSNTFQKGCIKLIKSECKDIYGVSKDVLLKFINIFWSTTTVFNVINKTCFFKSAY